MPDTILRVEDLSLRREGRDILRHVNLDVRAGEVHALLGLNGSGKSSLAYTLMGCAGYTPDAGRIVFDGRDVVALGIGERARLGITLAWQEPARFEGLPVMQYVFLGAPAAKTRAAVRDAATSQVLTTTEARAPGARGHMDCTEIVRGRAVARNVPVVVVCDDRAQVTHEAAIGMVNRKELETLMARGLEEETAVDVIVRGMLG